MPTVSQHAINVLYLAAVALDATDLAVDPQAIDLVSGPSVYLASVVFVNELSVIGQTAMDLPASNLVYIFVCLMDKIGLLVLKYCTGGMQEGSVPNDSQKEGIDGGREMEVSQACKDI